MGPDHLLASPRTALRWLRSWRHHGRHRWDAALDDEAAITHAYWHNEPPYTLDDPTFTDPEGTLDD